MLKKLEISWEFVFKSTSNQKFAVKHGWIRLQPFDQTPVFLPIYQISDDCNTNEQAVGFQGLRGDLLLLWV